MSGLPKTVTRQRRGCDFNTGPSVPESNMLTTRLPSHPKISDIGIGICPRLRCLLAQFLSTARAVSVGLIRNAV